ncbi:probable serine/threonine-protein kinase kinX [Siniperca chuatsi]|uniref:probable serine/threonine-protein kinase kinX n=1 Tax=Siniperca chuatsi TaxID=119488 RepID=UPI001CE19AC5|nr:probable serine/threonine-protein kinase kinX [Siniperca chuatsi]
MGHSEEDEGQIRKSLKKEALSLQARGEEGDAESVKIDISVEETSHDINMTTGGDCATQSKLINSGDEEAQKYLSTYEDSTHSIITQENTNSKSEEMKETKVDDAPVNVGEQSKYSCEQGLDEETKTEKQKPRATECRQPVEANSEDLTGEVKNKQGEDIIMEELKGDEVEHKRNVSDRDRDDDENTQMGHSEEDEGQIRKSLKKEALSLQARGEEGDAESVKIDISVEETSHDINMTTGGDCATQSKLINSGDEEAQKYLSTYEDSTHSIITQENTNSKSEEMKETKVDDAPVNVGEQSKYSCEQGLDEETKTEKQKPRATECRQPVEENSEDLTGEVKNKQGEDIIMEELKGDEVEHKRNVSDRDPDDDENTQMGHSEEDEGQIRKSLKKEALSLQARGEEGDAESVKIDISVEETSHDINMTTGGDCATQSKLINSGDEEAQKYLSTYEDSTHSIITQENTNSKSEEMKETKVDDAPVNVGEQSKYSCEQGLDEETKTEKQKPRATECRQPVEANSEDLTGEVKNKQGEDIIMEELKGDEVEHKRNVSDRDRDDDENTQMGHSEEDEGQIRKSLKKEALSLQARERGG